MPSPAAFKMAWIGIDRLSGSAGMKSASTRSPVVGSNAITRSLVDSGTSSRPPPTAPRASPGAGAGAGYHDRSAVVGEGGVPAIGQLGDVDDDPVAAEPAIRVLGYYLPVLWIDLCDPVRTKDGHATGRKKPRPAHSAAFAAGLHEHVYELVVRVRRVIIPAEIFIILTDLSS